MGHLDPTLPYMLALMTCSRVSIQHRGVTDRQTDNAIAYTALSCASRGNNREK